jgi:hypothetical protein
MNDESPAQDRDDLLKDSEEIAPARGVAFGVLLGAFIWIVPVLAVACWQFVG